MSRTHKDRIQKELRLWKNSLRWAEKKMNDRMWFWCPYCKTKYSGKVQRAMSDQIVCPLCGDAHTDSERIA